MKPPAKPESSGNTFSEYCQHQAQQVHAQAAGNSESKACDLCGGRGFLWGEKDGYRVLKPCICGAQARMQKLLEAANLPPKYWQTTLEGKASSGRKPFIPNGGPSRNELAIASQQRALTICRMLRDRYLDHFVHNKPSDDVFGLLLYGASGRGKTRLICSLLRDLIDGGLHQVKFVEYNELFKLIRFSFNKNSITYESILRPLLNAKVLVVDDLGTEISGNLVWVLDNIGYIINERYGRNLPTLFTCNHWQSIQEESPGNAKGRKPSDVFEGNSWEASKKLREARDAPNDAVSEMEHKAMVSYRLRSRIREMCMEIKLEGFDFRNRIAKRREMAIEHYVLKKSKKP